MSGHPSCSTIARGIALSGMRTPIVLRRCNALSGIRDDASSRKVIAPGRLRLRILNAALSTRQYSAAREMPSQMMLNSPVCLPLSWRSRSRPRAERSEQP